MLKLCEWFVRKSIDDKGESGFFRDVSAHLDNLQGVCVVGSDRNLRGVEKFDQPYQSALIAVIQQMVGIKGISFFGEENALDERESKRRMDPEAMSVSRSPYFVGYDVG